jgi:hypothetical protein
MQLAASPRSSAEHQAFAGAEAAYGSVDLRLRA